MPSFAPGRLAVGLLLVLESAIAWGQTTSSRDSGAPTQYVVSVGQESAALQAQNPFSGSVPGGTATAGVLSLSLKDAIDRGLKQNLGLLLANEGIPSARGQWWKGLSELLPHLTTSTTESAQQINLETVGINLSALRKIGANLSPIVGPFGIFDTRAYLTQSVFNWKSIQQTRSDAQQIRAAQYSYKDARELVVFAVASVYLQTIADSARLETAVAQQNTAQALYQQAEDQLKAGTTAAIDALRAKVELQARQQQVISARNELAKQKIVLGRVVGLPTGQGFTLTSTATYTPPPKVSLDEALMRAYASRADYQSALAHVHAAELARKAAAAGYYPSVSTAVSYGDIGLTPGNSHGTVQATAALNIPIFQGGKVHGDVLQAEAALRKNRELLDNLRAQIDQDVRNAFLDMQSAADQVEVARSSVDLADQTLIQARDRFSAGVTDNIEVIQAQQSVASANQSLISSLYSYNVSKVELGRAIGNAEAGVQEYLKGR
ncbi:MAG TPA: TolC family protein [Candidatus Angelobacter sp.]|nr:TolC family protein [Candidatus Angelobacter sp.]